MSGRGSRDSGMNTTRISFLAFHSFLNRSILAAASSLMGDPELWVGAATTQQNREWKKNKSHTPAGGEAWWSPPTAEARRKEKEGSCLLRARKVFRLWLCAFTHTDRGRWAELRGARVTWMSGTFFPDCDIWLPRARLLCHALHPGSLSSSSSCTSLRRFCCWVRHQVRTQPLLSGADRYANWSPLRPALPGCDSANHGWVNFCVDDSNTWRCARVWRAVWSGRKRHFMKIALQNSKMVQNWQC